MYTHKQFRNGMTVLITLNESTLYDAIRISKLEDGSICLNYAYDVPKDSLSPKYTYWHTFSKCEDLQEYLKVLDNILCADLDKAATVDVQMDGFPCAKLNVSRFLNEIRNGNLFKGIVLSLDFKPFSQTTQNMGKRT